MANGFRQRPKDDYDRHLTHLINIVAVQLLISITARNTASMKYLNINNAFIKITMIEEIYITDQKRIEFDDKNTLAVGVSKYQMQCKLMKGLYGLKQVLFNSFETLNHFSIKTVKIEITTETEIYL